MSLQKADAQISNQEALSEQDKENIRNGIDFDISVSNNSDVQANSDKRSYPLSDEQKLSNIEAGAQVNIAPIQYDTLVSPANEIDLASPSHVIYNQSNPTSAINFTLTNMQSGRTRQIEVQNNTNDAPETITINGSNTQNINEDISIWDDTAVMIIYIHCYSATDFEWWFYPKLK